MFESSKCVLYRGYCVPCMWLLCSLLCCLCEIEHSPGPHYLEFFPIVSLCSECPLLCKFLCVVHNREVLGGLEKEAALPVKRTNLEKCRKIGEPSQLQLSISTHNYSPFSPSPCVSSHTQTHTSQQLQSHY